MALTTSRITTYRTRQGQIMKI